MAEAILFPLADKILSAMSTLVLDQASLPWYAKKELRKLEKKITTVRNVLLDAQEQQKTKNTVKEWLRRLKSILYEADDLFDEVATVALRKEIIINKSTARKVLYFFTSSNPVLFNYVLGCKIKDVRERLDEICTDMRDFGFLVRDSDNPIIKRNEGTTSFVDSRNIFGREDDKKTLLQSLLSSSDDENVHIIPIVGMGGLGKTTLAQMIFNDNALNNRFDTKLKFWVCVSDDFNVERMLTEILKALGENVMNLEELLRRSFLEYTESTIKELNPYEYKMNDRVYYKMHDLVHDLAQYVVGDEVLILKGENTSAASNRVRHVSLYNSSKVPNNLIEEKTLRTIVNRTRKSTRASVEEAISHNRCVRVLDYGEPYQSRDLPGKAIVKLKHLRYLSCSGAKTIQESLCELLNLQYLNLFHSHFDTFPKKIENLRNLRVLMFSSSELICLPKEIRSLKSLRKLRIYNCSKLKSLGGLRCITSLEHLEISWCHAVEFSDSDFQGLTSLKYLILYSTIGLRQLPKGLLDSAATLTVLTLQSCSYLELTEEVLPKLLSLELLSIGSCFATTCLPEGMQLLRKLTHLYIQDNLRAFEERCKQGGLDWHKIAHVPHVWVHWTNVREEYSLDED